MESKYNELINRFREDLHKIPEIGYNEFKTSKYIVDQISSLGSFKIKKYAKTGLVADYIYDHNLPYIGFRADMDGLPVKELTDLPYQSEHHGFMHACGHDIHMSVALALANYINEIKPKKNISIIFQPAEEGPAGGKLMVEEGVFRERFIKELYALHSSPNYLAGSIGVNSGKMFAGTVEFHINLRGVGGHAAYPHKIDDVNSGGATLILQLNSIVSRFLNPINERVLSIGYVKGGDIANVIPELFEIHGTARSYNSEDLTIIKNKIVDMSEGVGKSFGLEAEVKFVSEYLPLINSTETAEKIKEASKRSGVEIIDCEPEMTGEDFGFMNNEVPGSIFWLGVGYSDQSKNYSLHNPKYNPNSDGFINGFKIFKELIEIF